MAGLLDPERVLGASTSRARRRAGILSRGQRLILQTHLRRLPLYPWIGWLMHFFIGTIMWGILFALIEPGLPGGYWLRGVIFSIGAWLLMMIIPMPTVGAGLFGLNLGIGAPIATLILHIIFGAVLGAVYGWLRTGRAARHPAGVNRDLAPSCYGANCGAARVPASQECASS